MSKIMDSLCLEGKITEQHAKEIEELLEEYSKQIVENCRKIVIKQKDGGIHTITLEEGEDIINLGL
jgi:hypothetical protein